MGFGVLGFRVWGLGIGVWRSGFRVWGYKVTCGERRCDCRAEAAKLVRASSAIRVNRHLASGKPSRVEGLGLRV